MVYGKAIFIIFQRILSHAAMRHCVCLVSSALTIIDRKINGYVSKILRRDVMQPELQNILNKFNKSLMKSSLWRTLSFLKGLIPFFTIIIPISSTTLEFYLCLIFCNPHWIKFNHNFSEFIEKINCFNNEAVA